MGTQAYIIQRTIPGQTPEYFAGRGKWLDSPAGAKEYTEWSTCRAVCERMLYKHPSMTPIKPIEK
jgi:hypothetical protein